MYNALVVELKNVQKHPNADRLNIADAGGYTVVTGLEAKDGDIGVVFPCDGQLSEEFAQVNDLVRRKDENGNNTGGMFDANRRVRAQSFRGVKSEAFYIPISSLNYTGYDLALFSPGDLFYELNGHAICNKYVTPATARAMKGGTPATKRVNQSFPEHEQTIQARHFRFEIGDLVYRSYKLHGTSQRFGYVRGYLEKKSILQRILRRQGRLVESWVHLVGTRRTIVEDNKSGFYGSEQFRKTIVKPLEGRLHKNEVLFFEVVGYTDSGQAIMGQHDLSNVGKEAVKLYGKTVVYSYGCLPGESRAFVYRIAMVNEDGVIVDLSWPQVVKRCKELGIQTVPYEPHPIYLSSDEDIDLLWNWINNNNDGPDLLCSAHPREGVVLRVERSGSVSWVKSKGWTFCVAEGIWKDSDGAVDLEEIS